MKPLNIITDNIPQIYSYKKKNNISDNFEKDNNKSEEKKIALTQRQTSTHFFINDSFSRLREYIKTPKPYIISKPIRTKMKYIKIAKKKALENFYISSIKSTSAKATQKKIIPKVVKNEPLTDRIKYKNKTKKIKLNLDDIFMNHKKNIKLNKSQQNYIKNNLSKKISSNISNVKTYFSSIPDDDISLGISKTKCIFNFNDIKKKNFDSDILGYKNYYVQDPLSTDRGVIKNFMDKIKKLRKDYYKNYYLKLSEFKTNNLYENILSQFQLNNRNHFLLKYYFDKYNNGFNIYWYKLNQELKRETENIENIKFNLKEIKMQINKLSNKIQKKLIKIIDIVIIMDFLKDMKKFSSLELGTPYYKLLDTQNEIINNLKNHENKTNYIKLSLTDKDLAIYSFIEDNKKIFNNKDINKIIISHIKEDKNILETINLNIKNLLMEEHYLQKDIESLKHILSDLLKDSIDNNNIEKILIIENNNCIKKIALLKTENKYLNYKYENMKFLNKNNAYGNLEKSIRLKILKIIKNLNKNNYITEEENAHLNDILRKNKPNKLDYYICCMNIIEKKINYFNKYKEEVINNNKELKKQFEHSCLLEEAKRIKIRELKEKQIKEQNVIDKLNKTKYLKEKKKDYFYVNRTLYMKNIKKFGNEKGLMPKTKNINSKYKTIIDIF